MHGVHWMGAVRMNCGGVHAGVQGKLSWTGLSMRTEVMDGGCTGIYRSGAAELHKLIR